MKVTVIPVAVSALRTIPKGLVKGHRKLGNHKTVSDHSDYSLIKISQNTE